MLDLILLTPETLSHIEAWRLWFDSVNISDNFFSFGITVRNWGRIGKIAEAVAASVVLLDIIGGQALRHFGERLSALATPAKTKRITVWGIELMGDFFAVLLPRFIFQLRPPARYFKLIGRLADQGRNWLKGKVASSELRRTLNLFARVRSEKRGDSRKSRWRQKKFAAADKLHDFNDRIIFPIISAIAMITSAITCCSTFSRDRIFSSGFEALIRGVLVFSGIVFLLAALLFILQLLIAILLLIIALVTSVINYVVRPVAWVIEHQKNENMIKAISLGVFIIGFYFDLLAS